MKMKLIFVFALIVVTPLVCKPRTKNNADPFWEIKELATKREKRGKPPRGRNSRALRTQYRLISGLSVQDTLRFLELKEDNVQIDYKIY